MGSTHPIVLLFGDLTDAWVGGMDYVLSQASTTPWLQSFLDDLFSAFKTEVMVMDSFLKESFGACSNFKELAQKYRPSRDQVGLVHAMLLYTVRAVLLLECVPPHIIRFDFDCWLTFPSRIKGLRTASQCRSIQARTAGPTRTWSAYLPVYGTLLPCQSRRTSTLCTIPPSKPVGCGFDSAASYFRGQELGRTARESGAGLSWVSLQMSLKLHSRNFNMAW